MNDWVENDVVYIMNKWVVIYLMVKICFFSSSFVLFSEYTYSPGGLFNGNDDASEVYSANDDRHKTSTTNEEKGNEE